SWLLLCSSRPVLDACLIMILCIVQTEPRSVLTHLGPSSSTIHLVASSPSVTAPLFSLLLLHSALLPLLMFSGVTVSSLRDLTAIPPSDALRSGIFCVKDRLLPVNPSSENTVSLYARLRSLLSLADLMEAGSRPAAARSAPVYS